MIKRRLFARMTHCEERNFSAARKGFGNDEDFQYLSHRRKVIGKTPFLRDKRPMSLSQC